MQILLVVTKGDLGGAQQVVLDLARSLYEKGHEVSVAYGEDDTYLTGELRDTDISVHQFNHLSRSKNPIAGLHFAFELKNYVQTNNIDRVHLHSSNTLFGALGVASTAAKSIFTFHGMSVLAPGYNKLNVLKYIYSVYFAIFSRFLDGAIYLTEANKHIADSWFIKPKKTKIIPNGIHPNDTDYKQKEKARAVLARKTPFDLNEKTIIGSIGRLAYQKNYQFLIQAGKYMQDKYEDLAWIVIGDGPQANQLQETVKKHGLEDTVCFVGAIPDAAQLIPAFDVFALVSRYEGLPITLIETLFADVPILASDVGGNSEVVAEPEYSTFEPGNQQAFCDKLTDLIEHKDLRKAVVCKQNEHKKQFTFETVLEKHKNFYQSL